MPHSDVTQLIPRDKPIPPGRDLIFEFKVRYTVTVNEDLTGVDEPITLDEIERMSGSITNDDEALWRMLAPEERVILEHTVALADVYRDPLTDERPRFELEWERRERLAGQAESWARSRFWLDEIPEPSAGASA